MDSIKITAIVGSLRKDSLNRQLALEAGRVIGKRAEFDILDYSGIPFFNQDNEHPPPEIVRTVRMAVKASDGIWFFTPEYNHSLPGVLKNLIDWLSRPISSDEPHVLGGKPAAISGITPGMSGTGVVQDHLVTLISFLNMKIMNKPRLTIPNAMQQTNRDGCLSLSSGASLLENQADEFLRFIRYTP